MNGTTEEEFREMVKTLPEEKRKRIKDILLDISTKINRIEVILLETPLEHNSLFITTRKTTLWSEIYRLYLIFEMP